MFKLIRQVTKYSTGTTNCSTKLISNNILNNKNLPLSPTPNITTFLFRGVTLSSTNMAKALLIVADGTEEMEAVITADVLRRGKVATTIAGLNSSEPVRCASGVKLVPDMSLDEAIKHEYDAVVLPGGLGGSEAFCASSKVGQLLKKQEAAGKYCAAICAAPTAFKEHGIGAGKSITSYPGMAEKFKGTNYKYIDSENVVVDGKLVTSRGPGTSFAFGLKLVELLVDKKTREEIQAAMLVKL